VIRHLLDTNPSRPGKARRTPLLVACSSLVAASGAAAGLGDERHLVTSCLHAHLDGLPVGEHAQPMLGFDPDSGANLRNYPPHRVADYEHMRLELTIPDMDVPRAEALQTLSLLPIGYELGELTLHAVGLDIESVTSEGREVAFEHDGRTLVVRFDPPVPVGERVELVTSYTIEDPAFGLIWTPSSSAWPDRPPQIHTQGQPEDNRYWFPMHDFPNERLTTELIVAAPDGFMVSSNGRLDEQWDGWLGDTPMDVYHWIQEEPHVSYLVSLIVGKFDKVDVGSSSLPMPVWVPPGRAADVERTYGMTAEMVELYERLLDEPYPWDRYAQIVVWNFAAGGMENTAATTMFDTAVISAQAEDEFDLMGLISHELGHQWFGDLITCNSWEHIWLNEGFATYTESLWWEHRDGLDGYQADTLANFDAVLARDLALAPERPGMASDRYDRPIDVFRRAANPYPKGASVLHMLRARVGDELFFRGLAQYVDDHRQGTVDTTDLRRVFEEVAGESLERFFHQWVVRPGVPRLGVEVTWNPFRSELEIAVRQRQNIDADNPAFDIALPVHIQLPDGSVRRAELRTDQRDRSFSLPLPAEPFRVVVDPEMEVLAEIEIDQPVRRWIHQLEDGPTLYARAQAARHLGASPEAITDAAVSSLITAARDPGLHHAVRSESVAALASLGRAEAIDTLARDAIEAPRVRAALAQAAADLLADGPTDPDLHPHLRAWAADTDSQRLRSAAVRALGQLARADDLQLILDASAVESQFDVVRRASLDALASMDHPAGLNRALDLAMPGSLSRTRAAAIQAVGSLAHHDPARAQGALIPMLDERVERVVRAAGEALALIGSPEAIDAIQRFHDRNVDPRWTDWARDLVESGQRQLGQR